MSIGNRSYISSTYEPSVDHRMYGRTQSRKMLAAEWEGRIPKLVPWSVLIGRSLMALVGLMVVAVAFGI